ncbi:MAG: acetyl-CoA carboxylase biotin carboxyl carrier protein subunit [Clostridia bacterium]|nr:acetyl-CoA carboxylase biotin carboxyl carrier protein subunit [Clostridia bacterium]MBR1686005.1 acetyl-CoA carboxylase biotin carboxyl carrier protein subunit [Clostridia bacterium]
MRTFNVTVNGQAYEVSVEEVTSGEQPVVAPAAHVAPKAAAPKAAPKAAPAVAGSGTPVKAPMPGTILDVKVKVGDTVTNGQAVCVLEAMKMENEIPAPKAGKVTSVLASKGASVNTGDTLVTIE